MEISALHQSITDVNAFLDNYSKQNSPFYPSQVQYLNLHSNLITSCLSFSNGIKLEMLVNLVYLNLSSNELVNTEGLEFLTHLKTLDLSNNHLTKIPECKYWKELKELNVSMNPIEQLDDLIQMHGPQYHLQKLNISSIKITEFHSFYALLGLSQLKILILGLENGFQQTPLIKHIKKEEIFDYFKNSLPTLLFIDHFQLHPDLTLEHDDEEQENIEIKKGKSKPLTKSEDMKNEVEKKKIVIERQIQTSPDIKTTQHVSTQIMSEINREESESANKTENNQLEKMEKEFAEKEKELKKLLNEKENQIQNLNDQLKKQTEQYHSEIQAVHQMLNNAQQQPKLAETLLEEKKKEEEVLKNTLTEYKDIIKKLTSKYEGLEKEYETNETHLNQALAALSKLNKQKNQIQNGKEELEHDHQELLKVLKKDRIQIKGLKNELSKLKEEFTNQIRQETKNFNLTIGEVKERISKYAVELSNEKSINHKLRTENMELKDAKERIEINLKKEIEKVLNLENDLKISQSEKDSQSLNFEKEKHALLTRTQQLESEIERHKMAYDSLEQLFRHHSQQWLFKNKNLTQQSKLKDEELSQLKQQNGHLKQREEEAKQLINEQSEKLNLILNELKNEKQKTKDLNKKLEAHQLHLMESNLKKECLDLQSQLNHMQAEKYLLAQQVENYQKLNSQLQLQQEKWQQERLGFKKEYEDLKKVKDKMLDDQNETLRKLKSELSGKERDYNQLEQKYLKLEDSLHRQKDIFQDLSHKNKEQDDFIKHLQNYIKDFKLEKQDLLKEREELQKQLNDKEELFNIIEMEVHKLKHSLSSQQSQLQSEYQDKLNQKQEKLEQLEKELKEAKEQIEVVNKRMNELEEENKVHIEKNQLLIKEKKQLEKEVEVLFKEMEKQKSISQQKIQKLKTALDLAF